MPENAGEVGPNMDTQIGIALGLGFSKPETAKLVSTPEFPAGCSERTVFNHINASNGYCEAVAKYTAFAIREQRTNLKEVKVADVRKEMEKLLAGSIKALEDAITGGDWKAAEAVLDRLTGKATQTNVNLVAGRVDVHHHQMPAEVASAMDGLIASGKIPLGYLTGAQEAEVVGE